jgi:hypothetical protein
MRISAWRFKIENLHDGTRVASNLPPFNGDARKVLETYTYFFDRTYLSTLFRHRLSSLSAIAVV